MSGNRPDNKKRKYNEINGDPNKDEDMLFG